MRVGHVSFSVLCVVLLGCDHDPEGVYAIESVSASDCDAVPNGAGEVWLYRGESDPYLWLVHAFSSDDLFASDLAVPSDVSWPDASGAFEGSHQGVYDFDDELEFTSTLQGLVDEEWLVLDFTYEDALRSCGWTLEARWDRTEASDPSVLEFLPPSGGLVVP